MSITAETAKQHADDPAVLCCRAEAGTILAPSNFEDPAIFPDLIDSGLLNIDGALKLGQVLNGTKLTKTVDSLTAVTADIVDRFDEVKEDDEAQEDTEDCAPVEKEEYKAAETAGMLHISIGEGKDIDIQIPVGIGGTSCGVAQVKEAAEKQTDLPEKSAASVTEEEKVEGELTRKHYKITEVKRGPETKFDGTVLYIREGIEKEAADTEELVEDLRLEIITPDNYHVYSEAIMDLQPIACKEGAEAELGSGVTRVLDGVVMVVSGTDANGVQIGEFGAANGYIDENMMWGRPGAAEKGEIFIKTQVTIKAGKNMERPGPMSAHRATDYITAEIREAMKKQLEDKQVADTEVIRHVRKPGKKKVVICKEIMGQGAMHDNFLFPTEPCGTLGAKANVDLGNVPVCASPLEVLDGCIHALTCIGPASKEMTRHYWREPLVIEAMNDPELDLVGVVFVGSPQANTDKFYVSRRLGQTCKMMDADGAFVTTEGFGNNHVDFVSHIEQIGKRGIPVVGFSFCAHQGALVVGNQYCDAMVDLNKANSGFENGVLENNCLCKEDAIRGIAMLKAKLAGKKIKPAEKKYNQNVKLSNIEVIESGLGMKVDLVPNSDTLPECEDRRKKYGVNY